MNHNSLIRNTINKYNHLPQVQEDMRKILKYASSQTRMFLDPIINNEPPKAANSKLAALQASTDDFEATEAFTPAVKAAALAVAKAVVAEVIMSKPGTFESVMQELSVMFTDQPDTRNYLKQIAQIIIAEIEAIAPADLLETRKAA